MSKKLLGYIIAFIVVIIIVVALIFGLIIKPNSTKDVVESEPMEVLTEDDYSKMADDLGITRNELDTVLQQEVSNDDKERIDAVLESIKIPEVVEVTYTNEAGSEFGFIDSEGNEGVATVDKEILEMTDEELEAWTNEYLEAMEKLAEGDTSVIGDLDYIGDNLENPDNPGDAGVTGDKPVIDVPTEHPSDTPAQTPSTPSQSQGTSSSDNNSSGWAYTDPEDLIPDAYKGMTEEEVKEYITRINEEAGLKVGGSGTGD